MAAMAPAPPNSSLYRWRDPSDPSKRYVLDANGTLTVVDSTSTIDIFKTDPTGEGWKYFVKHVVGLSPERDPVEQLSLIFGAKAEYIPDNPLDRPRARVTTYVSKERGTPAATPEDLEAVRRKEEPEEFLAREPEGPREMKTFKCKVCRRTRLDVPANHVTHDPALCIRCHTQMYRRGIKTDAVIAHEKQERARLREDRKDKEFAARVARKRPGALLAENGYPLCLCGCGDPVTDIDNLWCHGHARHGMKLVEQYEQRQRAWEDLPREIQMFIQANAAGRRRAG